MTTASVPPDRLPPDAAGASIGTVSHLTAIDRLHPALIATIVFVIASANLIAHYGHGRAIFLVIPTTALLLGAAALLSGLKWHDLGVTLPQLRRGLPWAGVVVVAVVLIIAVAVAIPPLREFFLDERWPPRALPVRGIRGDPAANGVTRGVVVPRRPAGRTHADLVGAGRTHGGRGAVRDVAHHIFTALGRGQRGPARHRRRRKYLTRSRASRFRSWRRLPRA